jgi:hypothetical protein
LELPFSKGCLDKATAEQLVVAAGHKLVVEHKPVVAECKLAAVVGCKLLVVAAVEHKLLVVAAVEHKLAVVVVAVDHNWVVEHNFVAAVVVGTTLQAIKKQNEKKIHSFLCP